MFHSLDKIISVIIHIMPPLVIHYNKVTYTIRWFPVPNDAPIFLHRYSKFVYDSQNAVEFGYTLPIIQGMAFYLIWQAIYHYAIIIHRADNVFSGTHATSFTYLFKDYAKKRATDPLTKLFVKCPERYRVYLFEYFNFLFALVTALPAGFLYHSFALHTCLILFLVFVLVFNGGSFYMEVFSRKYAQDLARLEAMAGSSAADLEKSNSEQDQSSE